MTSQSLAQACGGICTVANSKLTPWSSAFRILRVKLWPAVGTSAGAARIIWNNSGFSDFVRDEVKEGTVPQGATIDRGVVCLPPKNSLARSWVSSAAGTATIFSITSSTGSIIDIDITTTMSTSMPAFPDLTIVTGTLASVYWAALDTAKTLIPIGRPTAA